MTGAASRSCDADALDRVVAGDEVPGDAEVPPLLPDRASLLRRLDRYGRVDDVPPLFDRDRLHVEVPEDVGNELVRLIRILDDMDVLVHEPLQLRDVLAFLPDRLPDVPFLHDEDELVSGVDAVDNGRPREILEQRDVLDRLLVENNLGHANPSRSGCS